MEAIYLNTNKTIKRILSVSLVPFQTMIGLAIRLAGFRVLWIKTSRIGHLICDTDCVTKQIILKKIRNYKLLLPYDKNTIANRYFLKLLTKFIIPISIPFPYIYLLKSKISQLPTDHYSTAIKKTAALYKINAEWGNRPSPYKIPREWHEKRKKKLIQWGFHGDIPYVCVHCRSGEYSPNDEYEHLLRNVNIHTFSQCFHYLVREGFAVIRIGDSNMSPAPKIQNVFDYALSGDRTEELDFVLGSGCEFFLGCSSGAALISSIFTKPVVSVGMALPFNFSYTGRSNEIGIPKLYRNKKTRKLICFKEIFESGVSEFRETAELQQSPYELVENTPGEILGVVQEMVLRSKNQWTETKEDIELQDKVHSMLRPGHYCYGTASRCGAFFLRKYHNLLK